MEAHEVLTDIIDGINRLELYRPHVSDPELARILDKQVRFAHQEYQNLSTYLNQHRGVSPEIYRSRSGRQPVYGLRNPSPVSPAHDPGRMDDRDVASGMLGCHKSSAILKMSATLECADPTLRQMMLNSAVSCAEMAYETFTFMNQKGMYQVPTMQDRTQHTLLNTYHVPAGGIGMGARTPTIQQQQGPAGGGMM
ncbi:MAG: spore coat protein [Firmicutes bacterium]|nr:spore coat protein [Bacillota bacterium]